jgi:phosphotransferase system IIB component
MEWKIIKDYENYMISNTGLVKDSKNKIIRPAIHNGYYRIDLFKNDKRKHFKVHRLVCEAFIENPEKKPDVDHINHNKLDNNINNLRWCTNTENSRNRKVLKTNKLGIKGVYEKNNRFIACIGLNNKTIYLGSYKTLKEASKVRKEKARELFKEFCNE